MPWQEPQSCRTMRTSSCWRCADGSAAATAAIEPARKGINNRLRFIMMVSLLNDHAPMHFERMRAADIEFAFLSKVRCQLSSGNISSGFGKGLLP